MVSGSDKTSARASASPGINSRRDRRSVSRISMKITAAPYPDPFESGPFGGSLLRARPPTIICPMVPSSKDPEKKLESLREKIRHHEYSYYVLDNPEISDAEFD